MMDFTKKGNQSTLISTNASFISNSSQTNNSINTNSSSSASSSIISCAASAASSIISIDSASFSDPYNLSFLTDNKKYYNQLLEDLSIIDDIQDTFYETDSSLYDKQVLDIARHVSLKQKSLDTIIESELCYITDFQKFGTFGTLLKNWLNDKTDKELITKFKLSPARNDLDTLFSALNQIAIVHASFLKDLKDRIELWGPTQLISDIFDNFYTKLTIYDPFMMNHPKFVMLLDTLYKLPTFEKFIDATLGENTDKKSMNGLLHYIHVPLHRLDVYNHALKQLMRYSDRAHPDYYNLLRVSEKFKALEKQRSGKVRSRQSHLMALEAFLSIEDCPVQITINRRLLLFAQLIKVDLDDLSLTTDVRMYFLYNDSLIYCKKLKEKKGVERKLEHKGTVSLSGAIIRLLSPEFLAKMCEVKKPLFRIGKKADTNSLTSGEAFGFELITSELNVNAMSPLHQNYQSASAGAGAPIRRRHAIRTQSLNEQNIWFETMRKAIRTANATTA